MTNTIARQIMTIHPTKAAAAALAASLLADDPATDYRVVENLKGYFVAIFEEDTQVYTI